MSRTRIDESRTNDRAWRCIKLCRCHTSVSPIHVYREERQADTPLLCYSVIIAKLQLSITMMFRRRWTYTSRSCFFSRSNRVFKLLLLLLSALKCFRTKSESITYREGERRKKAHCTSALFMPSNTLYYIANWYCQFLLGECCKSNCCFYIWKPCVFI